MVVFEDGFRPWPHVYKGRGRSKIFYSRVDDNLDDDLTRIKNYLDREDSIKYCQILRDVLKCFGYGIIDSLEYTMKHYIKQTDGALANDKRDEWEKEAVQHMVSHNNYAERPFAVVKALSRMYPSLSLQNLSQLTHSIVNGTHRCADTYGQLKNQDSELTRLPGIALTAHPALRKAVNSLCSVRRKSLGIVTRMCREAHKLDTVAHIANRKQKALVKYNALVKQQANKAAMRDKAEMTASSGLCIELSELQLQLKSRCNNKEARVTFLKDQVYARISGEHQRQYPNLGSEYRKLGGKLRISSKSKSQSDEDYLMRLVAAMIHEDSNTLGINDSLVKALKQDFIRVLPSIAPEFTNPKAIALKLDFSNTIAELAQPQDDPMYLHLHAKYHGALLYDNETRASHKLFRISAIQFVRSYSKSRHTCWEATCEPVFYCTASGAYLVPQEQRVEGSTVILATALVGYALTEYLNGLEGEPAHLPWVDNYIAHFKTVVEPTCSLASLPPTMDSPSYERPSQSTAPTANHGRTTRSSRNS